MCHFLNSQPPTRKLFCTQRVPSFSPESDNVRDKGESTGKDRWSTSDEEEEVEACVGLESKQTVADDSDCSDRGSGPDSDCLAPTCPVVPTLPVGTAQGEAYPPHTTPAKNEAPGVQSESLV